VPPAAAGCPPNVLVRVEGATVPGANGGGGWFGGGGGTPPLVVGRVTVLNGESYAVPVRSVQAMVFPDNSPVAPVYADCRGGSLSGGQARVPASPVPFQYGREACAFEAPLPTAGPSAGAYNWRTARAVVTLSNGARCYSDVTDLTRFGGGGGGGGGGGWPWWMPQQGGGGGGWVIGSGSPSSGGSSSGGGGSGGWGSSSPSKGLGGGLPRAVGGSDSAPATPTTMLGGGGGAPAPAPQPPALLGGSASGGRKMLWV